MIDNLPPEMKNAALGVLGLLPVTALARVLYHARLVQLGHRKFWSRELLLEGPTAILCAIIGGGLSSYLGLDIMASNAVAGVCGWLGPRGIEVMIVRVVEGRKAE